MRDGLAGLVQELPQGQALVLRLDGEKPEGWGIQGVDGAGKARIWPLSPRSSPLSSVLLAALARHEVQFLDGGSLQSLGLPESFLSPAPAMIVAPVIVKDGLWGLVGIKWLGSPSSLDLTHPHLNALKDLAEDTGVALFRNYNQGMMEQRAFHQSLTQLVENLDIIIRVDQSSTGGQHTLYGEQTLARIFGPDILGAQERLNWLADRLHPGDRARVERFWKSSPATGFGDPEADFLEYRVQTLDGVTRQISERVHRVRDAQGRILRVYGRLSDATAEIRAREDLQRFEESVERDSRVVLFFRPDGLILYCNQSATINLGAAEGRESQSQRLSDFLEPGSQHSFLNTVLPMVAAKGSWSGDLVLYHHETGSPFHAQVVVRELTTDSRDTESPQSPLPHNLVLLAQDRTQSQRDQQRWMERMGTLRCMSETSTVPSGTQVQKTVEELLRMAAAHFGASLAFYARATGSTLSLQHSFCTDRSLREDALADANLLENSVFQQVWRSGDMVEVLNPPAESMDSPLHGLIRWAVGIVVTLGPRRHGVLLLADAQPRSTPMEEVDSILFRLMGRCLGSALERHDYRSQMMQALEEAEAANEAKSRFLAVMSHELRTPLNGVLGFAEFLKNTELSPQQSEAVNTIESSSLTLLKLLGDILDYTQIESAEVVLDVTAVEIRRVVEEVTEGFTTLAADRGVELIWGVDVSVPAFLEMDEARFRQILVQLVGNALKHTFNGLVHLSVGIVPNGASDAVGSRRGDTMTLLAAVRDTGLGMSPEEATRLFQPFGALDTSITRLTHGAGLGLAICKRLCTLMGGGIEVRSDRETGTTISFHFRVRAVVSTPTTWLTTPIPDLQEPLANRSVVLVSKLRELRHALTGLLLHWKMKVVALGDLRDLQEDAPLPDLVVACEEDILDGGMGVLRQRLGSIPLLLLERAHRPGETPPPADTLDLGSLQGAPRLLRSQRPVRASELHNSIISAIEPGLMDSSHPFQNDLWLKPMASRYPLRVLVVEDNPTNLRVAMMLLSNLGYHADHAANGVEAVDAVRLRAFDPEASYDLVLMDIHMPEMDGLEAARQIRRLTPAALDQDQNVAWMSQPYIAALTADALPGDREKCLAVGMDDYMTKPMSLDALRRLVKRANKSRKAASANQIK